MHKVQTEYGDACLNGVRAIIDGHLHPMNPNESPRNQIYLYNNIFFSRAVDTGLDTLKVSLLVRGFLFFHAVVKSGSIRLVLSRDFPTLNLWIYDLNPYFVPVNSTDLFHFATTDDPGRRRRPQEREP